MTTAVQAQKKTNNKDVLYIVLKAVFLSYLLLFGLLVLQPVHFYVLFPILKDKKNVITYYLLCQ